jgi:hypothetical protein
MNFVSTDIYNVWSAITSLDIILTASTINVISTGSTQTNALLTVETGNTNSIFTAVTVSNTLLNNGNLLLTSATLNTNVTNSTLTISGDTGSLQGFVQFSGGSANSTYTQGVSMGTGYTFSSILNVGKGAIIGSISMIMNDPAAQKPAMFMHLFDKALTGSYSDNSALNIGAADRANYVTFVSIPSSSWVRQGAGGAGNNYVSWNSNLAAFYNNSTDNNLYLLLEAQSSFNTSAGTPTITIHYLKN